MVAGGFGWGGGSVGVENHKGDRLGVGDRDSQAAAHTDNTASRDEIWWSDASVQSERYTSAGIAWRWGRKPPLILGQVLLELHSGALSGFGQKQYIGIMMMGA